jgi:hypothetical protein
VTPEEKAVIEAAIIERNSLGSIFSQTELTAAVDALLAVEESYRSEVLKQEWRPATFADCLAGDRIRIGDQESDVIWTTGPQQFHARNREWIDDAGKTRDHQTPWEHIEVRMDLSANPGRREYVPSTPCEILCTPERAAALMLNAKPVDK